MKYVFANNSFSIAWLLLVLHAVFWNPYFVCLWNAVRPLSGSFVLSEAARKFISLKSAIILHASVQGGNDARMDFVILRAGIREEKKWKRRHLMVLCQKKPKKNKKNNRFIKIFARRKANTPNSNKFAPSSVIALKIEKDLRTTLSLFLSLSHFVPIDASLRRCHFFVTGCFAKAV